MDLELAGKVAIVTGGSRGIGKAIALELGREGADLVICARDRLALDATAAELAAESGRKVAQISVDVRDREQVDAAVEQAVAEFAGWISS